MSSGKSRKRIIPVNNPHEKVLPILQVLEDEVVLPILEPEEAVEVRLCLALFSVDGVFCHF